MKIQEAVEVYIKWKYQKRKRAAENNAAYLRKFVEWLTKETNKTEIEEIDDIDAGRFQNYLENKNYAQTTVALFVLAIRDIVKYFYLRRVTNFNFQLIEVPEQISRFYRQAVKSDQVDQITSLIGESLLIDLRDKLIHNFLFSSGVRVSELTGLNAKQIDVRKQAISIPNKKHPNKYRVICWDDETHRLLMLWLEKRSFIAKDEALFISFKGATKYRRITPRSVQRMIKKYAIKSGIDNARQTTPHCYRHGFIQNCLSLGMDLTKVQDYAGHKNINSTKHYAQWQNVELETYYKENYRRNNAVDKSAIDNTLAINDNIVSTVQFEILKKELFNRLKRF